MASEFRITLDPGDVPAVAKELIEIIERRGSLPEFARLFRQITKALPNALEAGRVDAKRRPAAAGEVVFVAQFRKSFLRRVAAIRALDRKCNAHGASV
jgi:hypothetical protein